MKKAKKEKKECFYIRFIKNLGLNVKKIDLFDVSLTKLSVASGVLFLLTIWPKLLRLMADYNKIEILQTYSQLISLNISSLIFFPVESIIFTWYISSPLSSVK